ncbi:MAG: DnaJ domain-containing protein [Chloroflexi bacterium]|nr:DnaJ domain-containing protein [Chloroflexota bacterium]
MLGLDPTASLAEVKAAYRRLAKANHPDAAGEAALPRFLAIQAAYERLIGPTPGRTRRAGGTGPGPARPRAAWEADPARSNATHRAYGGRARRPAGADGKRTGRGSGPGAGASSGSPAGSSTGGSSGARGAGGSSEADRDAKKATLGSTSYDHADREAFEPDWVGASWYGTTSGTYWTINPKEYADPRKHGPEYQARARRAAKAARSGSGEAGAETAADAVPGPAPDNGADEPITAERPPDGARSQAGRDAPRHTTTSWWDATAGSAGDTAPDPAPRTAPRTEPRPRPAPSPHSGAAGNGTRTPPATPGTGSGFALALTTGAPPSTGWRVARAIIAWLPIGLAIGWASGELTGCGRFSASCDQGTAPIVWLLQVLVFGLLLALPTVAGWAVVGALVSLVVAVPATLFATANAQTAAGGTGSTGDLTLLVVVLVLAWLGGIGVAFAMERGPLPGRSGPVS